MLKFKVSEDLKWLRMTEFSDLLELRQVQISFTKKVKNHWFFEKKGWNGEVKFFYKDRFLPIGLWGELIKMGKEYNIEIEIEGLENFFCNDVALEDFRAWAEDFFKGAKKPPRDYQIDAAHKIIRYKGSVQELATNAGKTLIVFMVIAYMMQHKMMQKFLMIVPNTNLIIQAAEDFQEYESHRPNKIGMSTQMIYGGAEEPKKEANVVIGTFQSLVKREADFLGLFDVVFTDEAHFNNCVSIKTIIGKCTNAKWKFGLTGTLGDAKFADYYTIQANLGPLVKKISPDFLFQNDFATPVDVKIVRMSYLDVESRKKLAKLRKSDATDPMTVYNIERKLVVNNPARLEYVCQFIAKATKNSLVLFQSVQDGYGTAIYDRLRELTSDKEIFYVDGAIKTDVREEYKTRMKTGENRILIASFKTFSTGISIDNLHNIYLVESYKSEIIIKQSIGRMMRKHEDKEKANVIDFVDDFSIDAKQLNYLMKHSNERIEIYKRENFPYKIYEVKL